MHDRYDISEFALERGVEVCAALDGAQAVAVRQLREDTDVAAVFELDACDPKFSVRLWLPSASERNVRVAMVDGGFACE